MSVRAERRSRSESATSDGLLVQPSVILSALCLMPLRPGDQVALEGVRLAGGVEDWPRCWKVGLAPRDAPGNRVVRVIQAARGGTRSVAGPCHERVIGLHQGKPRSVSWQAGLRRVLSGGWQQARQGLGCVTNELLLPSGSLMRPDALVPFGDMAGRPPAAAGLHAWFKRSLLSAFLDRSFVELRWQGESLPSLRAAAVSRVGDGRIDVPIAVIKISRAQTVFRLGVGSGTCFARVPVHDSFATQALESESTREGFRRAGFKLIPRSLGGVGPGDGVYPVTFEEQAVGRRLALPRSETGKLELIARCTDAITDLHQLSARAVLPVTTGVFDALIAPWVTAVEERLAVPGRLRGVALHLFEQLAGRPGMVAGIHGDFTVANCLFDHRREVSGIVDWVDAVPEALALIDVVNCHSVLAPNGDPAKLEPGHLMTPVMQAYCRRTGVDSMPAAAILRMWQLYRLAHWGEWMEQDQFAALARKLEH